MDAVDLAPVDLAALARSFGGQSKRVDTLPTAFASALKADRLTRIDACPGPRHRETHTRRSVATRGYHAHETGSRGRGRILTGGDQLHRIWLRIGNGSGDNAMVS